MKKMNIGVALFFIVIAGYVLYSAQSFPGEIDHVPGPGYFPKILSGILIALSLMLIVSSRRVSSAPVGLFAKENTIVFIAAAITLAYFAVIYVFGFLIATPVYLIAIFRFFRMSSWRSAVLAAAITTAASYAVFTTVLEVQLPSGLF